jgi:hypothetical protein
MAPTRFTSGALITRNNFVHSTEGSRDPAPLGCPGGVLVFVSNTPSDRTEYSG